MDAVGRARPAKQALGGTPVGSAVPPPRERRRSTLDEVADRAWDQLRYSELMQAYRLLSTQVTQYNVAVTLALVTLLGFAIDWESWGLAASVSLSRR